MAILTQKTGNMGGIMAWNEATTGPGRIVVFQKAEKKCRQIAIRRDPRRILLLVSILFLLCSYYPDSIGAQEPADSAALADSLAADSAALVVDDGGGGPPAYLVFGLGYGSRSDDCVLCETPDDNKGFTGYLSLGRPLMNGVGIGVDVSIWRRGRPGTPLAPDSTGVPVATSLTNSLGNVSLSFSYDYWHFWVRAGGGLAWGSQDLEMTDGNGDIMIHTASGWGIGYTAGLGATIPVASILSISIFGNWNVGQYDMMSPQGLAEREAKHQYFDFGVGLAMR